MKRTCGMLMLLLAVVPLSAADLQTGLSPTTARVGEALHFRLKVSGAAGKTIRFGRPSEAKWSVLQTDSSRLKSGELEYVIAVYDTGRHEIEPVPVIVGAETLRSAPVAVNIVSILPDSAQVVKAIKPFREHPFQWRELKAYAWIPALILLFFAAWWLFRKYRRSKQKRTEDALIPLLPPHEEATRSLTALRDKKYPPRGMLMEFYSEFSHIMRRYLERRYDFPALEMTTYDLSRTLDSEDFPALLDERLLPVLREADLVKFAKFTPDFNRCESHIDLGFEIVAATRLIVETAPEAKAA